MARLVAVALVDLVATVPPFVAGMAVAAIAIDEIHTVSVETVVSHAVIYVCLAVLSCKTYGADAEISSCSFISEAWKQSEVVHVVQRSIGAFQARGTVLARQRNAFRNVDFTHLSLKARVTQTSEIFDAILAGGPVETRVRFTVVDVVLAVLPCEAGIGAIALVAVDEIDAGASVEAGTGLAFVDVRLALKSRVARPAATVVLVDCIHTRGSIHAGLRRTFVDVLFTVDARVSWLTQAAVVVHPFFANASILTRLRQAFVHLNMTVISSVPWAAETLV